MSCRLSSYTRCLISPWTIWVGPACHFAGYRLRKPEPAFHLCYAFQSHHGKVTITKLMQAQMPSSDVSVFVVPPKAASFTWENQHPSIQRRGHLKRGSSPRQIEHQCGGGNNVQNKKESKPVVGLDPESIRASGIPGHDSVYPNRENSCSGCSSSCSCLAQDGNENLERENG